MESFLDISLIIVSIALIASVVLQSKGAGLGARDLRAIIVSDVLDDAVLIRRVEYPLIASVVGEARGPPE